MTQALSQQPGVPMTGPTGPALGASPGGASPTALGAQAAGDNHAAALTINGEPYVWGANEAGLLGLEPDEPDAPEPLEVRALS